MARTCNCDSVCNCAIRSGDGIIVTGSGVASDPYLVSVDPSGSTQIQVTDTGSVNLTISGEGSDEDPYVLSAQATLALAALVDVDAPAPADGDTLIWVTDHWEAGPPPTVPPGAVNTGAGISGDGSAVAPISVRVSGSWGVDPLDQYGSDDLQGQPTYIDSDGNIRAQPAPTSVANADEATHAQTADQASDADSVNGIEFYVSETDPGVTPTANRVWIQPVS